MKFFSTEDFYLCSVTMLNGFHYDVMASAPKSSSELYYLSK